MTTSENMSRKRPAPGASPLGFQSQPQQLSDHHYANSAQPLTDDQFFDWGANAHNPNAYSNQPIYGMPANANMYQNQPSVSPSNQLTRRPVNPVMARPPALNSQWMNESPVTTPVQQQDPAATWSDDIEELVAKAQIAKKDAQSRRKQIPPFVMKLHSFLENPKNTDLIRWADDGKSFVVLNEDEFANKLIPELFKHNNYASFVRQLNMYGFHKKVGLSDNSMRASERKAKSPSEYWNPFFRRGYPDLLWLIQKPKNQTSSQRNRNQQRGKSEERDEDEEFTEEVNTTESSRPRPQLTLGQAPQTGSNALTSEQFQTVQRELMMIRRQQSQITHMLGQLKREHDALVDQANDYQDKHSRHEQSINAILTFLATLYNRSLQNHEGAQDIAKVFAQTLSQDKNKGSNLVDVDNLVFDFPEAATIDQSQKSYKRPRLMITDGSDTRANTLSPSNAASPIGMASRRSSHMGRSPQSAHVEEIFDPDVNQPTSKYQSPSGQQQQDMMSLIHNTNARNSHNNTPVQDFSHVLNDIESSSGSAPVSAAQRENMVRVFNDQARRSNMTPNKTTLNSPKRSNQHMQFDAKLANAGNDLDDLAQLQAAQDKSVENLTNILQPLSPTGSIPGIGDGQDLPPPPLNIDDFLNSAHDYFADFPSDGNGNLDFTNLNNAAYGNNNNNNHGVNNYDFADDDPLFGDVDESKEANNKFLKVNNYDGAGDGGRVESVASSSEAPTPQNDGNDAGDWSKAGGKFEKRRIS